MMQDLISRQAEINAIKELCEFYDVEFIFERIEALLSAQPDICKWKKNIIQEIDKTIKEIKHNGKHHAEFVRENGELVIFGLEIAKHIIEEGEEHG